MKQVQIQVNPVYEKIVPPLTEEEYQDLKQSIKKDGQWVPIIVNTKEVILDGHHRYKACYALGIEPRITHKNFQDENEETIFVVECNLKRRHLNAVAKFELAEILEPLYIERSKRKQIEAGKLFGRAKEISLVSKKTKLIDPNDRKTTAQVAKVAGMSRTTYERLKEIKKSAPEIYENVKSGQTSIAHAYTQLNTEKRHDKMVELPIGEFNVVLADPPWKYDVFLRGTPERHYDVMELEALKGLKIPFAKDCILFLWVTNPKVPDAIELLDAWGFEYKTNMVWIKDKFGTGYYCRSQHELLFIAKKGNPPVPQEGDRPSSIINAVRTNHSKKPAELYDLIEKMYPSGKYLELFARNGRKNWKSWGNQL